MSNLDKIFEVRRENLRRKIREAGGPGSLTMQLNLSNPSYLSHLAGPTPSRVITEKTARKVESLLGLPAYWLDTEAGQIKTHAGELDTPAGLLGKRVKTSEIDLPDFTASSPKRKDAATTGIDAGRAPQKTTTETAINTERLAMCLTILASHNLTHTQKAKIAGLMYACDKPDSELNVLAESLADLVAPL